MHVSILQSHDNHRYQNTQSLHWHASSHVNQPCYADNAEEYDSEASDSEDEEDEYAVGVNGLYGGDLDDDDDDKDDSEASDEADDAFVQRSSVIIEEVGDDVHGLAQITATKVCSSQAPSVLLLWVAHVIMYPCEATSHDICFSLSMQRCISSTLLFPCRAFQVTCPTLTSSRQLRIMHK